MTVICHHLARLLYIAVLIRVRYMLATQVYELQDIISVKVYLMRLGTAINASQH